MPTLDELESRWQPLSPQVIHAMKEWRRQHPRATLQEIEAALDTQLARLRAQMLQDTALTSSNADLPTMSEAERPRYPECGVRLEAQGTPIRTLVTEHDQTIELSRSYATCPQCGAGLFPPR
jgi:NMD protein affecting ribosome stability and mRNA decay